MFLLIKWLRRILLYSLILTLTSSQYLLSSSVVAADESEKSIEKDVNSIEKITDNVSSFTQEKYSEFLEKTKIKTYSGKELVFKQMSELVPDDHLIKNVDGQEAVSVEQGEDVTLHIDVPEHGLYYVGFTYTTDEKNILPAQVEMKVNGVFPYFELRNLVFESRWKNPEEIKKDKYGNEIIPQPIKVNEWLTKFVNDSSNRSSDPLLVELIKGENEINLNVIESSMHIQSVIVTSPIELTSYEKEKVDGDELIQIEAEDMTYKNDSSIRAGSLFDVDLTPYNSNDRVLNYLDSDSFKKAGQKVEYEFDVKESGYYYLGLHYRQDSKIDFPVFMNIEIDDEIPFREFKNYPFAYKSDFTNYTLTDNEKSKIPIYLEKGTHKVSFTISSDHIRSTIENTERIMSEIQSLSLELKNLIGQGSDKYRDLKVEEYIPGITDQFLSWAEQVDEMYKEIQIYNPDVKEIGAFTTLKIVQKQFESIAQKVNKLITRKDELASINSYLGELMQSMENNGIAIDQIYFYQNEKDIPKSGGVLKKQIARIDRLFKSFGDQDYAVDMKNPDHLQVWINRPRQYIEIIQQLIEEQFTPQTGIKVDVSIMPDENKLILSNAAGDAPDVAVGINYALPFEIAIRGALQDLTEFDDFDEVKSRFPSGLFVPSTVENGIYSIPDTMNFWVMFYREDILETLGLEIPETIEEVKSYLPELQRKGMNFFFPTAGMQGLKTFAGTMPIIYQNGGRFYNETIEKTAINSDEAIEGMRELTELFTIYNLPYDVPSFYQQFRDGSLPIGISDYQMYNLILNAAPEIANSWNIALIPGVENEEGEIERWSAGGAESNIIFKETDKKDESWEFLKWWSSAEVQSAFGNILQTTYGREYIWNPANIQAYENLPWVTEHKKTILNQTEWLTEVPRVPGSYMVEREISNAYNSIVLDGENLRTAIDLASKRINRETLRKLEEFGYIKDGKITKEYPNPEVKNE